MQQKGLIEKDLQYLHPAELGKLWHVFYSVFCSALHAEEKENYCLIL